VLGPFDRYTVIEIGIALIARKAFFRVRAFVQF